MSIAFLLTTLVVVVTPGTGVVYTLAAGLSRGRRASVVAAFACTLGWATLREKGTIAVTEETAPRSTWRVIVRGVLINFLNPKLTVFFFAFLPQFVSPDDPDSVVTMLVLGGVFMLVTFVVFAAYGILAASVRSQVMARPRVMTWLRRAFAGSFLVLGAKLATTSA